MARQRSKAYFEIRDEQAEQLADPTWKPWGPRWNNRVGLQRMTAVAVASRAHTLLEDINLSTHRDNPVLEGLLEDAREAVRQYYFAASKDNWDRLMREGQHAVVGSTPEGQKE